MRVVISLLIAGLFVYGCSDPTGTTGELLPDEHSIGWGLAIADSVRDIEFPEGLLFMVSCIDINDEGECEPAMPWQSITRRLLIPPTYLL